MDDKQDIICRQITEEFFTQKTNRQIYLTRKECKDTFIEFHAYTLKRLKEEKLITSKKEIEFELKDIMEDIDMVADGFPARVHIEVFYTPRLFVIGATVNGTLNSNTRSVLESLSDPDNKKTFLADLLKIMAQGSISEYLFDERPYMRALAKLALNNKGE